MKNKRHVSLLVLGLVTAISASAFMLSQREPKYDGKSASYWLEQFGDVEGVHASCTAFKAMGSKAVPFLVRTLERKPSRLGEFLDEKLHGTTCLSFQIPSWVSDYLPSGHDVEDRRETAAFMIGEIGPEAAAAIGPLINALEEEEEREKKSPNEAYMAQRLQSEVYAALESMGERGVIALPKYLKYLESDDDEWRQTGADLVGSIGPKAKAAVPLLRKAVGGANEWLRFSAAVALWKIDYQTNTTLSVFTAELSGASGYTKIWSLRYLSEMGPTARAAAPLVRECLGDSLREVKEQAGKTLKAIESETSIQPACATIE